LYLEREITLASRAILRHTCVGQNPCVTSPSLTRLPHGGFPETRERAPFSGGAAWQYCHLRLRERPSGLSGPPKPRRSPGKRIGPALPQRPNAQQMQLGVPQKGVMLRWFSPLTVQWDSPSKPLLFGSRLLGSEWKRGVFHSSNNRGTDR
jgi:hypothetical protein